MRIEDEIKMDSFPSIQQKLNINLMYSYNWTQERLQSFFAGFGLTAQQYNVLRILRNHYPQALTTSHILEQMVEKNAGVSRLVDRLVKKGLVSKRVSKQDRRLVDVTISEEGTKVLEQLDEQHHQIDDVFNNLSLGEMVTMNRLLDKLRG